MSTLRFIFFKNFKISCLPLIHDITDAHQYFDLPILLFATLIPESKFHDFDVTIKGRYTYLPNHSSWR